MVKPIMKDVFFLGQKSELATKADLQVGKDLQDTYLTGKSCRVCGYGCKYDWCEKESNRCKYGIRRCCDV